MHTYNLLKLPTVCLSHVYSFDDTYKELFDRVLSQMQYQQSKRIQRCEPVLYRIGCMYCPRQIVYFKRGGSFFVEWEQGDHR